MSALFGLEILMDQWAKLDIEPGTIARRVVQDAGSLATVGLCFGFLVRHIDRISDELDEFLVVPEVWDLEFRRVSSEGHLHVQGNDDESVTGRDRRRWTPLQVAMHLTVTAARADDKERLAKLCDVGRRLIEAAGGENAPPNVRQWVAYFDWSNYYIETEGEQQLLKVQIPESVAEALAPVVSDLGNIETTYRLLHRYRLKRITPYRFAIPELPSDEEIANDYHDAVSLEPGAGQTTAEPLAGSLAGVAAAILLRLSAGPKSSTIPDESLEWALKWLLYFAVNIDPISLRIPESMYPDGADRKAALALPLMFQGTEDKPPSPPTAEDVQLIKSIGAALIAGMASHSLEVRQNAVDGMRPLFERPCEEAGPLRCWHDLIWEAVEASARNVVLEKNFEFGRREIEPIVGNLCEGLARAASRDLMLTHIELAAVSLIDASRSQSCLQARARQLRGPVLDAYARAARQWAEKRYHRQPEQSASFASAVLRAAMDDGGALLVALARKLRDVPVALSAYFGGLLVAATYEVAFVPQLARVWPELMTIGMAALQNYVENGSHHLTAQFLDVLMPGPRTLGYFDDAETTRATATANWFPMESISANVEEWLNQARGNMQAVDAMVGFLKTRAIGEQIQPGLTWIQRLVVDEDGTACTSGFLLVGWLRNLREAHLDDSARRAHRKITDALVLGNFTGARDLQRLDE
jgi:hypothetical protein